MIKKMLRMAKDELKLARMRIESSDRLGRSLIASGNVAYVIPADAPGGVGDDAMVRGAVEALREVRPDYSPMLVVPSDFDEMSMFADGVSVLPVVRPWSTATDILAGIRDGGVYAVLGADILDGHYSCADAVRRIRSANFAYQQGLESRIVGFSLNENPRLEAIKEFRRLGGKVPLYLRDPISYERAVRLIDGDIRLSADAAFLLPPTASPMTEKVAGFVGESRDKGKTIIGLNMHGLFARSGGERLVHELCHSLSGLIEARDDCAFVLIPHDFRSYVDDRKELRQVVAKLKSNCTDRVMIVDVPIRAGEIKQICSTLDGVVTGRMHLAIAALGVGVPIFGIVYQGKFEGLLTHFDLDNGCVRDPLVVSNRNGMLHAFDSWRKSLDSYRSVIKKKWSSVRRLSLSNFE